MKRAVFTCIAAAVAIALAVSLLVVGYTVSNQMLQQQQQAILIQARLCADALDWDQPLLAQCETLCANLTTNARITVIDPQGNVLCDTSVEEGETLENHESRPEVEEALLSGSATSLRQSDTTQETMLYGAVLTENGNIVRLSEPSNGVLEYFWLLLPGLLVGFAGALLVALLLAGRFAKSVTRPVQEIGQQMMKIGEGEKVQIDPPEYDELLPIAQSTLRLSQQVEETVQKYKRERRRIDEMLVNMEEGFILTDSEVKVLSINHAARKWFNCEALPDGQDLVCYTRSPQLCDLARQTLEDHQPRRMDLHQEGSVFDVRLGAVRKGGGLVIVLVDVTGDRQMGQVRQEFFASASHELKTPITSIGGYAELLEQDSFTPQQKKDFLAQIRREVKNMTALINDILTISRLESGETGATSQPVEMEPVIREALCSVQPLAEQNQVTLRADCEDAPTVYADRRHMYSIVSNLIRNAIQYNRPGGKVEVECREKNGEMYLSVSDNGIGIPASLQGRVFERFFRVDKGRSRLTGGTGLGLSIVKHTAQYYGGTVGVDSAEGQGSRFWVQIPLKPALPPSGALN